MQDFLNVYFADFFSDWAVGCDFDTEGTEQRAEMSQFRKWDRMRGVTRKRAVVAFVLGLSFSTMAMSACTAFGQERFHQWSDNTGRFKVDAEFVRLEGEQVVLKRLDGREIKIPFERLSPESLDLAKSKGGMGNRPKSSGSSKKEKPSDDMPAN
ncbi:MAG: y domain 1, partial [Planctomycetota bacterium]